MFNFIVEDGTGLVGASSYLTLEDAENYFDSIGSDAWKEICGDEDYAERKLVYASNFFDQRYGIGFSGEPVNPEQGMIFPLKICDKETGIPANLKKAVLALLDSLLQNGELDHNANYEQAVKSESISLGNGALVESKTYDNTMTNNISYYAVADKYVALLKKQFGATSSRFIPIYRA